MSDAKGQAHQPSIHLHDGEMAPGCTAVAAGSNDLDCCVVKQAAGAAAVLSHLQ